MRPLRVIRLTMLSGILLFGLVIWVLQKTPNWSPPEGINLSSLVLVGRILWTVAIVGTAVVYWRSRGVRDARADSLAIIGFSFGEIVALFGAVVFFLTGVASWYLAGVGFLALSFVAFPGRQAA